MKFNSTFYEYQKQILKVFENELEKWDNKIHIVAPPWSWKTIIWIEIMRELFLKKKWISLILVPNIVLQYQWKDKIKQFFIEESENIDDMISFDLGEIKKINILTYQAISGQDRKESTKKNKVLTKKILNFFAELKNKEVSSIILDEAHHLTSWWSKVIFQLYIFLSTPKKSKDLSISDEIFFHLAKTRLEKELRPYVVWLTATPPFINRDYFSLDKNYIDLLGEVDYFIPTPAIIKSGKLAPYNDIVQFVSLPENVYDNFKNKKEQFYKIIVENKESLEKFFTAYLKSYNKNILEDKKISKILAFCNKFLNVESLKFNISNFKILNFDDIVYAISLWIRQKNAWNKTSQNLKKILYEIWYVWKTSKFVKFYSYLDKIEIYNPNKINIVRNIIAKEIENLWEENLRLVIITDFFEDIDWLLDCKLILKELKDFKKLKPTLVSGQGNYIPHPNPLLWKEREVIELKENILELTEKFNSWEIKILIWTRWILWEWWDSPKVNCLIDLTWISSFMSVNQVRWRAIRLDKQNKFKISNIYDIVTIDKNNILYKDFNRLKKKHNQVYWVNDSWLIVKGINHIYNFSSVNFWENFDIDKFNNMMLIRSEKRDYFYKLWKIWEKFSNKEQFILQLNINPLFKYFPEKMWFLWNIYSFFLKYKNIELQELSKKAYYDKIIVIFIKNILDASKEVLIKNKVLS